MCAVVCSRLAGAQLREHEQSTLYAWRHLFALVSYLAQNRSRICCTQSTVHTHTNTYTNDRATATQLTDAGPAQYTAFKCDFAAVRLWLCAVVNLSRQITYPDVLLPTAGELTIHTYIYLAASYQELCESNWINGKQPNENERKALGRCCYYYSSLLLRY